MSTHTTTVFRVCMPYVLNKEGNGWVLLNREYKPLGFDPRKFVKYEEFPVVLPIKITPAKLRKISEDGLGDANGGFIYLYGKTRPFDCQKAMADYLKRLDILWRVEADYLDGHTNCVDTRTY